MPVPFADMFQDVAGSVVKGEVDDVRNKDCGPMKGYRAQTKGMREGLSRTKRQGSRKGTECGEHEVHWDHRLRYQTCSRQKLYT